MPIDFKPFDELFAPAYQLTYISLDGHITVGPNTYSVFHTYTMEERQVIYQVCQKYLPWQITEEQEQWERTMYMYQYIIKSPAPFPYPQYPLSEEIIMAITWAATASNVIPAEFRADITFKRVDDVALTEENYNYSGVILETTAQRVALLDLVWGAHLNTGIKQEAIDAFITDLEQIAKNNLEAREI